MKNKLTDLNNHLFAQLERLGDEELNAEQLQNEVTRAKSISSISNQIIDNARLALHAEKLRAEYSHTGFNSPKMIGDKSDV